MTLARTREEVRKADTRHKIELGGLVVKSGLSDLDRAVLLGALIDVCDRLNGKGGDALESQFFEAGKKAMEGKQ